MKYSYMKFLMFEILHMKIFPIQILLSGICKLIYQLGNWKFNASIQNKRLLQYTSAKYN